MTSFFKTATINTFKGFGNILLNGFSFDITPKDKTKKIGINLNHFQPITSWTLLDRDIIDIETGERYCDDSKKVIRQKCAALFISSLIVQPIGLSLNVVNRVTKLFTFAQLWKPSKNKYNFTARLQEYGKDFLIVVSTTFIMIGLLFSSIYGLLTPYNGRKLFGTFERLAYSGGYQLFNIKKHSKSIQSYLLAPCFQPFPTVHLGGGNIGIQNAW